MATWSRFLPVKGGIWVTRELSDQMPRGLALCSWSGIRWIGTLSPKRLRHLNEDSWESQMRSGGFMREDEIRPGRGGTSSSIGERERFVCVIVGGG
ncbi:hypothetical protein AHAS_Ahas10G0070500 [Arachis hypogaea]